ncbi:MAG: histidine kinase, partial [Bryobacteraceae bacterium]|nr:histidine kinase [Bryobacteraceae bacterium]
TLNSISALIHEDPVRAETMIARLADMLRYTLQSSGEHEVQLRDELKLIGLYLEIEKIRFEDSLEIQIQVEDECFTAIVPNLILQPLVENAMRHGFSERSRPGVLRICARRAGEYLLLEVSDNGRGLGSNGSPNLREGVGLGATRRRLDHLYGSAQSLVLRTPPTGGPEVCIRIPFHMSSGEDPAESHGSHQSAHR